MTGAHNLAKQWNLGRTTYDSWPWMFGSMYAGIFETSLASGLASCAGPIRALVTWCSPYMTEPQKERLAELRQREPTSEMEAVETQEALLELCMQVADNRKAWEYVDPADSVPEYVAKGEDLERPLP